MSLSRVQFLKSLGASVTGLALGSGIASAAQALANASNTPLVGPPAPVDPNHVHFIGSGPSAGNRIAITFDDGPTPGVTNVVLDELKKRNLRSTFFMIGKRVVEAPDLARRVLAEGHEVCNHTFNHLKLNTLPDQQVDWEIQKTQDTIAELLNHRPTWLRPPYGAFRKNQIAIPQSKELGVVFWSVDPRDWSQPGEEKIVSEILTHAKPGSIILCHDLHKQTANCVGRILDGLLERKFEFVNISTFLGQPYQKQIA
ncbi:polysaccharide deacetylase family protein [Methylacidiphilales bacterium]|nr:polysaccharide deacetylase family protein [Candidatus Methylacidiphilales bacterium]